MKDTYQFLITEEINQQINEEQIKLNIERYLQDSVESLLKSKKVKKVKK